jgi:hypothetical protein
MQLCFYLIILKTNFDKNKKNMVSIYFCKNHRRYNAANIKIFFLKKKQFI